MNAVMAISPLVGGTTICRLVAVESSWWARLEMCDAVIPQVSVLGQEGEALSSFDGTSSQPRFCIVVVRSTAPFPFVLFIL
jgi:hypothetical protein